MPDLFDPLRAPDQLGHPPLPAEEVRRRGDRLRRRRTVTAATGATLAVALVVGGGLALGGGLTTGSTPAPAPPASQAPSGPAEPSPAPDVDWLTSIPTGFPLADDLEQPVSTEEELAGPGRDVRVFDVPFEACGREVDLGAPVDSLGVRYTQPEWYDGRVLQVYGDDAAARAVLEELVGLYDNCPKDVYEGPPDSVAVAMARPVPLGEEGYLVTRTFSTDGLRTTGLELLHVVRVGNALLVSNQSSEGGSSDATVARSIGEREPVVAEVAAAMCIYAADGCGDGWSNPDAALEGALLRLDDVREVTSDLRTSWAVKPGGDRTPLGCWTDPVEVLEPVAAHTRAFEGAGSTGITNSRAATAVIELGDAESARTAYDVVVDGLQECNGEFAVAHEPVVQRTSSGPAVWRVAEGPAPEICTECDTGWIDAQAVALVGTRLVLLSIAYTGDMMSGADSASSPMNDAIEAAARRAAASDLAMEGPAFGPRGLGPVHLGMSALDVESNGAVLEDSHGQGCTTFTAEPEGEPVLGFLTENQGVSVLLVDAEGIFTPAGVGIGATEERVREAYPDAEDVPMGLFAPVPGFSDRQYTFAFEDGRLVEMALRLEPQPCVG